MKMCLTRKLNEPRSRLTIHTSTVKCFVQLCTVLISSLQSPASDYVIHLYAVENPPTTALWWTIWVISDSCLSYLTMTCNLSLRSFWTRRLSPWLATTVYSRQAARANWGDHFGSVGWGESSNQTKPLKQSESIIVIF